MNTKLHLPGPDAPFALLREMAEVPALIRQFNPEAFDTWRQVLAHKKAAFITGEGSSRIFPAKNLITRARQLDLPVHLATEGARQAAQYAYNHHMVIGLSNSGRTRETVHLFQDLQHQGIDTHAITATRDSPLTAAATHAHVLTCGAEQAVAASKSVIEQALCLHALLDDPVFKNLGTAADTAAQILATPVDDAISTALASANTVYVAGPNTGVAEEIALKSCEIGRQKSFYLEGTYVLHGIEEVMQPEDCVILIAPYPAEMERYANVLTKGIGLRVIAISAEETPFPTIRIPSLDGFDHYLQLLAGWTLLTAAGQRRGIDIDKTIRARKVGNAVAT